MLTRSGFKRPQIERTRTVHTPVPEHLRRQVTMARADAAQVADPKTEAHRNPALLEMARGRQCLIQLPHKCLNPSTETTVAAHSNWGEHGKAGARKADDEFSVASCFACHSWLDQGPATEAEKRATFAAAHQRQIAQWERIATDTTEPARFRRAAQWALNHLMRK
jgi:Protein of unknown function (DUF1364)